MIQLKVGDRVYEGRWYKKVGTIGHILGDHEKYGAPYSVTFDNPDADQPGRDYFSADDLQLIVPVTFQSDAEKQCADRLRRIEEMFVDVPEKPDTTELPEWEEAYVRTRAAIARSIRKIIHEPVDMPE